MNNELNIEMPSISKNIVSLARKYRPQNLQDLIGQQHVVKILKNALQSNMLKQVYLLTGIRGVGKTTIARIIAKTINCTKLQNNYYSSLIPCEKCDNCIAINSNNHQDIIEMDAASHTGVDDIREVIENTKYKPISALYKVFIIDEVHMLSKNAFNALLKTIEEPPEHVKFIFATTEINKIPLTVISRCQRFDLHRLSVDKIVERLKFVLQQEGAAAQDEALAVIANSAMGSMRDALSILDQAITTSSTELTEEDVRSILGIANSQDTYTLLYKIVTADISAALEMNQQFFIKGNDPSLIVQELMSIVNNMLKFKIDKNFMKNKYSTDIPKSAMEMFIEMASKLDSIFLLKAWQMLSQGLLEITRSEDTFTTFDMIAIRIAHLATENSNASTTAPSINSSNISGQLEKSLQTTQNSSSANASGISSSLQSIDQLLNLCIEKGETMIYHHLKNDVVINEYSYGSILLEETGNLPKNFLINLKKMLEKLTGSNWNVERSEHSNAEPVTITEKNKILSQEKNACIKDNEMVQKALEMFPNSSIKEIKST